jgi:hypothetical protein
MPAPRVRVGGSGFTTFNWTDATGSHLIGFADNVTVNPVQPVATPVAIQPINAQRPLEVITPGAHREGTIQLTLTELYGTSVWQRLSALSACQDIVDIMREVTSMAPGSITVTKTVKPGFLRDPGVGFTETFFGIVIASVEDNGEQIAIDTMAVNKNMTLWYTHSKKSWINGGDYRWPRNTDFG